MVGSSHSLPLRVRQHIRDELESPNAAIAQRIVAVSTALGYQVNVTPDWQRLWQSLQDSQPDHGTFVSNIVDTTTILCTVFLETLERMDSDELFEGLLDDLSHSRSLEIVHEISSSATERFPHVLWQPAGARLVLILPKAPDVHPSPAAAEKLREDLITILTRRNNGEAIKKHLPGGTPRTMPSIPAQSAQSAPTSNTIPRTLPLVNEIDPPDMLMQSPPYLFTVQQTGSTRIVVQCSHQKSLLLMEEYLTKWNRNNPNYTSDGSTTRIRLAPSAFGMSQLHDSLTIEAYRIDSITPMLILTFVQTVLGYRLVGDKSDRSLWEFSRAEPIR